MKLNLGNMVSSAQMAGGINLFSVSKNYSTIYLDLFSTGILFEYNIVNYLQVEFLDNIC